MSKSKFLSCLNNYASLDFLVITASVTLNSILPDYQVYSKDKLKFTFLVVSTNSTEYNNSGVESKKS